MTRGPDLHPRHSPLAAAAAALVLLVTVSPWALGFSDSHAAVAAHIAFAMGIGPIAVLISALPAAAISTAVGGGWLVASPWALGYASLGVTAWSADLLAGMSLVALSAVAWRARDATRPAEVGAPTERDRP